MGPSQLTLVKSVRIIARQGRGLFVGRFIWCTTVVCKIKPKGENNKLAVGSSGVACGDPPWAPPS